MRIEETLSSVWKQHVGAEFAAKSADEAVETMTADSYVNAVPLMIGARGRDQVRDFYANHFLSQLPPDIEIVTVSRTVGQGRVVDEMIIRFTHSLRMDWLLPGVPPTGKRVELPFVGIIQFRGDKIAHEHLYWDQASLLVQVGLLDRTLPVRGGEIAAQVLNPIQPMNELIHRAMNNNGRSESRSKTENPMRKSYWLGGTRLSVIAGPAATEGRYDLVEGWFPTGAQVPPHVHSRYTEQIYVLDGEFTVWASRREAVLRPGDGIFIPAGTAHAVHATGDGPARALVVASPSGFARLITEVGTPDDGRGVPPSAPMDMDLLHRVSAELGDEILGPPGTLPTGQTCGVLACEDLPAQAKGSERRMTERPVLRTPSQGRTIAVVGSVSRFLATGEDTNGKYAVWEAIVPPGGGPPPHVHSREEEGFYVLEGEITFQVGDERIVAPAGTFTHLPVGTPHSFKNESRRPAKLLTWVVPAGLERMFFEFGVPVPQGATTAPPPATEEIEKLLEIAPRYAIEIRLPQHV